MYLILGNDPLDGSVRQNDLLDLGGVAVPGSILVQTVNEFLVLVLGLRATP